MGNVVPALFWFVPTAVGLALIATSRAIANEALYALAAGIALGWAALNQVGFWDNARMRSELLERLEAKDPVPLDHWFVGFATNNFFGLLDAHEDVGFLVFEPNQLTFISETRRLEIERRSVGEIRYRLNAHSVLGLGRWVSVEGHQAGVRIRLQVEPREHRTMLKNLLASKALRQKLETWRIGTGAGHVNQP